MISTVYGIYSDHHEDRTLWGYCETPEEAENYCQLKNKTGLPDGAEYLYYWEPIEQLSDLISSSDRQSHLGYSYYYHVTFTAGKSPVVRIYAHKGEHPETHFVKRYDNSLYRNHQWHEATIYVVSFYASTHYETEEAIAVAEKMLEAYKVEASKPKQPLMAGFTGAVFDLPSYEDNIQWLANYHKWFDHAD